MDTIIIFIFGFIGGFSPEIVRIHKVIREGGFIDINSPYLYIIFSLLLASIGGFLAIALQSPNILNAIWIGASTPLIITTFNKISPV